MKTFSTKPLATLTLTLALSIILAAPSAFAQSCDPAIKREAEKQMAKNVENEAKRAQDIFGGHMDQPDWLAKSDGLLTACAKGNWASFLDKVPVIMGFNAKEKAVKAACDEARKVVSKGSQSYQGVLKTVKGYEGMLDPSSGNFGNWSSGSGNTQLPTNTGGSNVNWGNIGNVIPGIGGSPSPGTGTRPVPNPKQPPGGVPGVTP